MLFVIPNGNTKQEGFQIRCTDSQWSIDILVWITPQALRWAPDNRDFCFS